MKRLLYLLLLISAFANSQQPAPNPNGTRTPYLIPYASGKIGVNTTTPDAAFDIVSTIGGFLPPRMTTTQRDALTPHPFEIIGNTTLNQYEWYNGSTWIPFLGYSSFQAMYGVDPSNTTLTDGTNTSAIDPLNVYTLTDLEEAANSVHGVIDASGVSAVVQVEHIDGGDVLGTVYAASATSGVYAQSDGKVRQRQAGVTITISPEDVTTLYTAKWPDKTGTQTIAMLSDIAGGGGSGDVVGPASATDNAITRFDSTTGKLIQNSNARITDGGSLLLTGQATQSYSQGQLYYDTDNECLTFHNNDSNISLQIGQESYIRVRNSSGSTIANGAAVYISGSHPGTGLPTIELARADSVSTLIVAGIATESIANNSIGYITSIGFVNGLDTSAFSNGQTVYLSAVTAGGLTATAPTAPNYRFRVGIVTKAAGGTAGVIHVTPSTGALGNGTANQVLAINSAGTNQEFQSTTGTGNIVRATSPTLVTPNLGTPSAATLTNATGLPQTGVVNLVSDLAGKQATITGAASTITTSNLTANRALSSDASGKVAASTVTSTEQGYLSGVTSPIQTQFNAIGKRRTTYAFKNANNASVASGTSHFYNDNNNLVPGTATGQRLLTANAPATALDWSCTVNVTTTQAPTGTATLTLRNYTTGNSVVLSTGLMFNAIYNSYSGTASLAIAANDQLEIQLTVGTLANTVTNLYVSTIVTTYQ